MEAMLDMPVITRTFTVVCALVTCLIMNGTLSVGRLYLYFPLVLHPKRHEVWRLLTNFCVFDTKFSLSWLLSIYLFARHSAFLERSRFRNDTRCSRSTPRSTTPGCPSRPSARRSSAPRSPSSSSTSGRA